MAQPLSTVVESPHAAEVVRLLSKRSWSTGLPLLNSHVMEVWFFLPPAQLASAVKLNWATDADLAGILEETNQSLYPSQVTFIDLSKREVEILRYLAGPMDRAAIAEALFISENTLKTHVRSIYRKLAVSNRAQAVLSARSSGLLRSR